MLSPRCTLLCTIVFALAGSTLSAETFRNPIRIPTQVDPWTLAAADINGDGIPDFVWGDDSTSPATFHVLLSQPGGGYLPGANFLYPIVSTRPPECVFEDVNNDQHPDLVCSSSVETTAYIHVFLGRGDGTLQPPIATTAYTSMVGSYAVPVVSAIGDLNGDGLPDILVQDLGSGQDVVLLSDGKGAFKPPIPQSLGLINQAVPVAADVNGGGIPDLLGRYGPEVAIGNGDGTFAPTMDYSQVSYFDASCTFHDMDGDGHLDAVCGYPETSSGDLTGGTDLIILHGNADGSFNTNPIAHKVFGGHDNEFDGFGTFLTPLEVADLNGDGFPDIVAQSGDGFAVVLGGPNLSFSTPLHYAEAVVGGQDFGTFHTSVMLDLNGDHLPDVVSAGPNGIYLTYAKPDGTFASAFAPEVTELMFQPTLADFNGDGIPDIAATGDDAVKVSLGNGDGTFAPAQALSRGPSATSFGQYQIVHGDFNGDGKLDLLTAYPNIDGPLRALIFFGHGDGTFAAPIAVPEASVTFPAFTTLVDSAVVDINHDGRSDLVYPNQNLAAQSDQICFMLSRGDGSFTTVATTVPSEFDSSANAYPITPPAIADFHGDGKLDAVYGSFSDAYLVRGHGDGTFDTTSVALPIPSIAGLSPQGALAVASGDFDGDGKQDFIVLAQYGTGDFVAFIHPNATAAWVYYGNGNGTFSAPVLAGAFDHNYSVIAAADLNRDGLADLVLTTGTSYYNEYAVAVIDAKPSRTFGPEINYTAGTGTSSLAITDLNNDGFPDLVIGNGDPNIRASSVTVLLNLGNAVSTSVTGTLTSTPNPSALAEAFTITAALSPPTSTTLIGNVTFAVDGTSIGAAPLTSNSATIAGPTTLSAGVHQLTATWPGDSTYPALNLTAQHIVASNAVPLTLTLTSSLNPSTYGQAVTFTVAFTATPAGPFTGTLSFYDGTSLLAQQQPSTAGPAFTTAALAVGTHNITAAYSGDTTFAAATSNLVAQVVTAPAPAATTTLLTCNPTTITLGQTSLLSAMVTSPNGVPAGTITFTDNSTSLTSLPLSNGAAAFTYTGVSTGAHTLTATYVPTGNFSTSAGSCTLQVNAAASSATLTLHSSQNPAPAYSPISFTALLKANPLPSGFFNLTIGSNPPVAMLTSRAGNAAIYTTNSLAPGTYTVTATFVPSGNLPALSAQLVPDEVVTMPSQDFTLTGPTSVTARTESVATGTLYLTSVAGFAGTVTTSCNLPLPTSYTCTLTPTAVALTSGYPGSTVLKLAPILNPSAAFTPGYPPIAHSSRIALATLFPLAFVSLIALARRRRIAFRNLLSLSILVVLAASTSACGPDKFYAATPPGNYPLTITATGTSSGSSSPVTHTLNITLVLTP